MDVRREDARFVGGFEYDGPCPIAKQYRCTPVLPIGYPGQCFGAYDERFFRATGSYKPVGKVEGVQKATAGCVDIECGAPLDTELPLYNTCRGWEHLVRRCGSEHDQTNLMRINAGVFDCSPRRLQPHGTRCFGFCGDMTA